MELGIDQRQIKKYRPVFVPVVSIIMLILLSIFVGNIFWGRVQALRAQIATNEKQNNTLEERLTTLKTVQVEVSESSNVALLALPQFNPSVQILSHLNRLQQEYGTILDELTIVARKTNAANPAVHAVAINFNLVGDYGQVTSFISDLMKISPIVNLESADIQKDRDGILNAQITLLGYYAPLPETLPSLTSALKDFSEQEMMTLDIVRGYLGPSFTPGGAVFSSVEQGKLNPFTQSSKTDSLVTLSEEEEASSTPTLEQ